ncbi:MAG: hypothetical protein DRJ61_02465 [Acidobacteria bacterium]|nr:MAG: hypothetical protein DRJ61_02465 [Acidobacteriota bacterium]
MFMEKTIRNVLVVGVEPDFHRRFEPLLKRRHFDVDRVTEAGCALALVQAVAIDVLVLRYPLGNPSVESLLQSIRSAESPCKRSAVLVLASPVDLKKARKLADGYKTQVLSAEADYEALQETIALLLRAAPRLSVRITIRLEALLGSDSTMVLTQTENVSLGGMLVRVRKPQPVDARLRFELLLPEDTIPIKGTGEVVRHTRDWRGDVSGVGIKYAVFENGGDLRLKEFLQEVAPESIAQ